MLTSSHIQFIKTHLQEDVGKLLFKGIPFDDVTSSFIAQQISARQRMHKKLPSWVANEQIVFPAKLNLAQSSSEKTAHYKAQLISNAKVADLTGGFGIDTFALSKTNTHLVHVEKDEMLSQIAQHNASVFQLKNISFRNETAEHFLAHTKNVDWIYMDPSRRDEAKNRVFLFEECQPDILALLPILKSKCQKVLLKTSPLIDLTYGIEALQYVQNIHVVAVENEVKELLWELNFSIKNVKPSIKTIQFKKEKSVLFEIENDVGQTEVGYSVPLTYLYEPNAALMKVGKFNTLAEAFQLKKLHPNSHLFTSKKYEANFPGRIFAIDFVEAYKPKLLKKHLKGKKMNISTRNFPIVAKDLIKLLNTKDGGKEYAFFTTDINDQKIMISCLKETV